MNVYQTARNLILTAAITLQFAACVKKTESKEIFKDNFDRDNSSSSLGASWTISMPGGNTFFGINSAMAKPLGNTATTEAGLPSALYTGKISGGFKVSAKFIISGGDYDSMGYLVGRSAASDVPTDGYLCGYRYTGTVGVDKVYAFTLRKMTSGVASTIAEVAMHKLVTGKTDTITFTIDGTSLKCEMSGNSTISISVTDGSYGDGYVGILGGGNSTQTLFFDDFLVERL